MIPVEQNQLFLDGIDITQLPLRDLRESIAMVPQEDFCSRTRLRTTFATANRMQLSKVEAAAEQARLLDDIKGFPDGFETWSVNAESPSVEASGNAARLVCLACQRTCTGS